MEEPQLSPAWLRGVGVKLWEWREVIGMLSNAEQLDVPLKISLAQCSFTAGAFS